MREIHPGKTACTEQQGKGQCCRKLRLSGFGAALGLGETGQCRVVFRQAKGETDLHRLLHALLNLSEIEFLPLFCSNSIKLTRIKGMFSD